jgi:cell wall-associated NlpC family hydrolase
VIGSILGALVVASPGAATPTPSKASLDAQINASANQLEVVVEQYDATQVALAATKAKLAVVTRQLVPMHEAVNAAHAEIGSLAAAAYTSPVIGTFAQLLDASSTSELVNRLGLINHVAYAQSRQIDSLYRASKSYLDEQAMLGNLTNTQSLQYAELGAKRTTIEKQIAKLKAMRVAAYGPTGIGPSGPVDHFVPVFSPDAAGQAVKFAFDQLGKAYRWATAGPNTYDCSGLTLASWRSVGVTLPHNAAEQYRTVPHVTRAQLLPGDLVFYFHPIHHVGIYIGANRIINAPEYGHPVAIASINMAPIAGYGRP